jgi:hypothetical protein
MADTPTASAAARPRERSEFRDYEEWFTASPDPWETIVTLEHGGDRTAASTVRSMVTNAEPAQRPVLEQKLLAALAAPRCTPVARLFACRMLALIGSAKCVPALAPLLAAAGTADAARYALDAITDPAVDELYRATLPQLPGPAKIGLIGSIALRGDTAAAPMLAAIAQDAAQPAEVRAVAARAAERLKTST